MRLKIGSGFGIPVYIHWTFLLLPLWVAWTHPANSPIALPVVFVVMALAFTCIVLHEFGHALTARCFGIGTQDVTLYPIGGVARLLRMPEKPLEEILIAVAGPAVNVVIAIVLAIGLLAACVWAGWNAVWSSFAGEVGQWLLFTNVILVLFNMLPVFPMDGGRVLRAMLSWWLGHVRGTHVAVVIGTAAAMLMAVFGIWYGQYMMAVLGAFVMFVGQQELLAVRMRQRQIDAEEYEEPATVMPAEPVWPVSASPFGTQAPALVLRPRISVYTWDNQTGTWHKEPGTLS
jgi:Zn-dependent protease